MTGAEPLEGGPRPINDELALATGRVTVVKQDGAAALKMELEALMRRGPD